MILLRIVSSLALIAFEYLFNDDCNISSNNSQFCFLKIEEKLFHLSISLFKIIELILLSSFLCSSSSTNLKKDLFNNVW